MRRRLFRVLRGLGIVLLLGLGYALWGSVTGLWLPCPFHALTGLECPGCGVTRMCLALLRLDFAAAWAANPGLLLLSPLILALVGWQAMDYVRYIEKEVGCKIRYVSVGAEREAYIEL